MKDLIKELKLRGILNNITNEKKLETIKKSDGVYIGFDATSDSLHLGNYLQIMTLKHFKSYGYKAYAVLGGMTSLLGDPSGKTKERELIDSQKIEANKKSIKKQLEHFKIDVIDNSDFYKNISLIDFFRQVGKTININYMNNKQIVKSRLETTGMSFTEFSYQLIQGWDFKELYEKKNIKIQIGGSDQWGNITTGIELIRKHISPENNAIGITTNLLLDKNGNKFGKSENNPLFISKNNGNPFLIYQYLLNTSDEDVEKYLKMLTFYPIHEIDKAMKFHFSNPKLKTAQKWLAYIVVWEIFDHNAAWTCWDVLNTAPPDDFNTSIFEVVPNTKVNSTNIFKILVEIKFANSLKEARGLVKDKAIKINFKTFNDPSNVVDFDDWKLLIQKGKKHFMVIEKEKNDK